MSKNGIVYLVGAGPGDIGLLTVRGKDCLAMADVVLFDRLVNPLLLEWTKPHCEHVYCGKLPKRHLLRQEVINEKLIEFAKQGKTVVRLKGGDPGVFGRVGEEAASLLKEGIDYEVIPGITAGIGAATYAGIPVTHRDHGASFAVVTGHNQSESGEPLVDWQALATGIDTIAFYMGVKNLHYISQKLVEHGRKKDTPVVVIQWGTLGVQKVAEGTLTTIVEHVKKQGITNPAITLVGEVAALRNEKSWFEKKALFGEQILLGRTGSNESEVAHALRLNGADVFEFPRFASTINQPPTCNLLHYKRIVFLSPESVSAFFNWLREIKVDLRDCKAQFFAVSRKTKKVIEQYGCLALLWNNNDCDGDLLVIGEKKWEDKEEERNLSYGLHHFLVSHENTLVEQSLQTAARLLDEGRIKSIVFPSAESVSQVTMGLAEIGVTIEKINEQMKIICFGEKSSAEAIQAGYKVDVVMEQATKESLIQSFLVEKQVH